LKNKIDWLERIAGVPLDPNEIAAQLLLEVERAYTLIEAGQTSQIIDDWRARSVTLGREIAATTGNTTIEGIAVDIDQTGALIVKTADGQLRTLHAGEITIRNISGEYT
jgi:BirA family biotin operon repressor/biotin-[acetyl-CoA-carboxylase] ligase